MTEKLISVLHFSHFGRKKATEWNLTTLHKKPRNYVKQKPEALFPQKGGK